MMTKFMVVLDLEATCDEPSFDREQMEIIEIGACYVDAAGTVLSEFQTFIKPVVHPVLSAFCTKLTTITQAQVEAAPEFKAAIAAFEAWIAQCSSSFGTPDLWGSWGDYDRKQFERNARLLGQAQPAFLEAIPHVNLKARYAATQGVKIRRLGLGTVLREYEHMAFEGTPHRGIDDARNIAKLAMIALGLKPTFWKTAAWHEASTQGAQP
jgi:inhibitor of KinA sporulation pathway (predicted exonuclease)